MALPEVLGVALEAQSVAQNAAEVLGRLSAALGTSSQLVGAWLQERDALYIRQRQLEQQLQQQAANEKEQLALQQACISQLEAQVQELQSALHAAHNEQQVAQAALDAERERLQQQWQQFEEHRRQLDRQPPLQPQPQQQQQQQGHATVGTPSRGGCAHQGRIGARPTEGHDQYHAADRHAATGCGPDTPRSDSDASLPPSQPNCAFVDRVPETLFVTWQEQEDLFAPGAPGADNTSAVAAAAEASAAACGQRLAAQPSPGDADRPGPGAQRGPGAKVDAVEATRRAVPNAAKQHATAEAEATEMADARAAAGGVEDAGVAAAASAAASAASAAAWASREQELAREHAAQLEAVWAENKALQADLQRALAYRRTSQQLRAENQMLEQRLRDLQQQLRDAQAVGAAATPAATLATSPAASKGPQAAAGAACPPSARAAAGAGRVGSGAAAEPAVAGAGSAAPADAPQENSTALSAREAQLVSERDKCLHKYREAKKACREARQLARHWQSAYWGLMAAQEGLEVAPGGVAQGTMPAGDELQQAADVAAVAAPSAGVRNDPHAAVAGELPPGGVGAAGADADAAGGDAGWGGADGSGGGEVLGRGRPPQEVAVELGGTQGLPYPPLRPAFPEYTQVGTHLAVSGAATIARRAAEAEAQDDLLVVSGGGADDDDGDVDMTQAPSDGERAGHGEGQGEAGGGAGGRYKVDGGDGDGEGGGLTPQYCEGPRTQPNLQRQRLGDQPPPQQQQQQQFQTYRLHSERQEEADPELNYCDGVAVKADEPGGQGQPQRLPQPDRQQVRSLNDPPVGTAGDSAACRAGGGCMSGRESAAGEAFADGGPAGVSGGRRSPAPDFGRPVGHAPGDTAAGGGGWLNKRRSRSWDSMEGGGGGSEHGGITSGAGGGQGQAAAGPARAVEKLVPGRRYVQQQLPFAKQKQNQKPKQAPLPPQPPQPQSAAEQPPRRARLQPSQPWHQHQLPVQEQHQRGPAPAAAKEAVSDSDCGEVAGGGDGRDGWSFVGCDGYYAADGRGYALGPPPQKRKAVGSAVGGGGAGAADIPAGTCGAHGEVKGTGENPGLSVPPGGTAARRPPRVPVQQQQPQMLGAHVPESDAGARTAAQNAVPGAGAAAGGGGGGGGREGPGYKYTAVVRGREERDALQAVECAGCRAFYEAVATWGGAVEPCCNHVKERERGAALSAAAAAAAAAGAGAPPPGAAAEAQQPGPRAGSGGGLAAALRQAGGRHRFKYAPPATPEGFWDIGFGDTQD